MKYLHCLFKSGQSLVLLTFFLLAFSDISSQQIIESEFTLSLANLNDAKVRFSGFSIIVPRYVDLKRGNFLKVGLSLRNTGLIQEDSLKIKARSWGIGIPITYYKLLKNNDFFGGGFSYEYFFHYKQKIFVGDDKIKVKEFFSDRVNPHQLFVFLDYQTKIKVGFRVGIYLTNFFNQEYVPTDEDFFESSVFSDSSNIFFISLRYGILTSN